LRISVAHVKPLERLAIAIADCMLNYEHVEHPSHYNTYPTETIDMMVAIWGKEKVADWCEITAFKYRMRMGTKPDNAIEQDLKKEQWYLNKAKELRNEFAYEERIRHEKQSYVCGLEEKLNQKSCDNECVE
jgi:hypothetical protein